MARTAKEIQEQIDKLEAARKVTRARNGYAHYSERISYLKGELMLQREKEARATETLKPAFDANSFPFQNRRLR